MHSESKKYSAGWIKSLKQHANSLRKVRAQSLGKNVMETQITIPES